MSHTVNSGSLVRIWQTKLSRLKLTTDIVFNWIENISFQSLGQNGNSFLKLYLRGTLIKYSVAVDVEDVDHFKTMQSTCSQMFKG